MQEIEPISFNDFCESPETASMHSPEEMLGAFTMRSIGYWLQQNAGKQGSPEYKSMEAKYENRTV